MATESDDEMMLARIRRAEPPAQEQPEEFWAAMAERVKADHRKRRRPRQLLTILAPLAMAAGLVAFIQLRPHTPTVMENEDASAAFSDGDDDAEGTDVSDISDVSDILDDLDAGQLDRISAEFKKGA